MKSFQWSKQLKSRQQLEFYELLLQIYLCIYLALRVEHL